MPSSGISAAVVFTFAGAISAFCVSTVNSPSPSIAVGTINKPNSASLGIKAKSLPSITDKKRKPFGSFVRVDAPYTLKESKSASLIACVNVVVFVPVGFTATESAATFKLPTPIADIPSNPQANVEINAFLVLLFILHLIVPNRQESGISFRHRQLPPNQRMPCKRRPLQTYKW